MIVVDAVCYNLLTDVSEDDSGFRKRRLGEESESEYACSTAYINDGQVGSDGVLNLWEESYVGKGYGMNSYFFQNVDRFLVDCKRLQMGWKILMEELSVESGLMLVAVPLLENLLTIYYYFLSELWIVFEGIEVGSKLFWTFKD